MNNYIIKKIKLENFKLIKGSKVIDFKNNKLIVLDGPNGYGKTTIFDAIEILIKGYINIDQSYITEYNEGDKPVIYAYNDKKHVCIKGEFEDSLGNNLIISRIIKNPSTDGKISQLKDRFLLYELNEFNDISGKQISQNYINTKFNLKPNEDIYNLTHYMQQEDRIFFLKKKENERRKEMNKLFNMDRSTDLQKKIEKIKREINKKKNEIRINKEKIEEEIKVIPKEDYDEVVYKRLIKWKDTVWDEKDFIVDSDNYETIINKINNMKNLINHKEDFINFKNNEQINDMLSEKNQDVLKGSIILLNNLEKYDEIMKLNYMSKKLKKFEDLLITRNYEQVYEFIQKDIKLLKEIYKNIDFKKMQLDIEYLLKLKKDSNELNELVSNINNIRNNLMNLFKQCMEEGINDQECPLCGCDYKNTDRKLLEEVKKKEKYFNSKLDETGRIIEKSNMELEEKYITRLLIKLEDSIESINLNEELIDKLKFYYDKKNQILTFEKQCKELDISLEDFKLKELEYDGNIIYENMNELKSIIWKQKKKLEKQDCIISCESTLNKTFKSVFDSDLNNIDQLTITDIDRKERFIQSIYFKKIFVLKRKLLKLQKQYGILDNLFNKYDEIYNIYSKEIYEYSEYMISKLQIPIYIYSGKVIQDYQGGLGIFIKTEQEKDKQVRLKFVNQNKNKHDLINRFSSGQLSGVVISILLSLNKTFSLNYLNVILIDDPLQSMDDINMVSFVELLRNEFRDKQIILSTHDERISRYVRYKYKKVGINSLKYNVKEELNN